jgi:hypothetical protein
MRWALLQKKNGSMITNFGQGSYSQALLAKGDWEQLMSQSATIHILNEEVIMNIDVTEIKTAKDLAAHSEEDVTELYNALAKAEGRVELKKATPAQAYEILCKVRGEDVPPADAPPDKPAEKKPKAKDKKPAAPKKESKPKGPSYQDKIKAAMVANKHVISRDDLMEATGADSKNLSVAVSILKNAKRTKEPMTVMYIRKTGMYFNVDVKMGEAAYNKALKALEAEKKTPKKDK